MLEFGPFMLDLARCELRSRGQLIHLERKVFDLLRYLVEHRDRMVTSQELLDEIWAGTAVGITSLRRSMALLRNALGDDPREPRWISTLHGRGYRFIGALTAPAADPAGEPDSSSAAAASVEDYRSLLLGRNGEQLLLDELMRSTRNGTSSLFLLEGEAGIGKSRLLDWCAERGAQHGMRCVASYCREDEGAPTLWPWIQVVRELATVLSSSASRAVLHKVAPALAHVFPELQPFARQIESPRAMEPGALRFQAFQGVFELIREACARTPLVLLFDDLHRADTSSLALLEFLTTQANHVRVLIVGSMRPDGGDRTAIARIARGARSRTMSLKGLDEEEVLALLTAAAPNRSSPELAARIWQQTGGNPFFVHQVLLLASTPDLAAAVTNGSIASVLPRTVRNAIEQQCATLTSESLVVVRAGAVFGRASSAPLLAEVLDRSESTVLDALDEAVRARLLREDPECPLHYRYVHQLVRDVLYESLGSHQRAQLHGRVGSALEAKHADRANLAAELAHHFREAGTRAGIEKAVRYHAQAGVVAAARFDYAASIRHYGDALQLVDSLPDADARERCDLQAEFARQSLSAGFGEQAGQRWIAAVEQARAIPDRGRMRRAAIELGALFDSHHHVLMPHVSKAALLLEDAASPDPSNDRIEQACVLGRLAYLLEIDGRPEAADATSAQALALAHEVGDPLTMANALCFQHLRLRGTPDAAERARIARELLRHADQTEEYALQLLYRLFLASDMAELGRFDEWEIWTTEHQRLAERFRSPEGTATAHRNRAMRRAMLGRFADAAAEMQRATALAEHCEPHVLIELGQMTMTIQFETVGVNAGLLDQLLQRGTGPWMLVGIWGQQHLERPDVARQHLQRGLDQIRARRRRENWKINATLISESIAYLGDAERAEEVLEWLRPFEGRHVLAGSGGVYMGPVLRSLGLLHGAMGHWDASIESLEEALRCVQALEAQPWITRLHLDLSRSYAGRRRADDRERAATHARAGSEIAARLGMTDLARLAQRRLAACND